MTQLSNSHINAVADLKPGYTLGAADVALLQEMARRLLAVEGQEPVYQVFDEVGGWFDIEKCDVSRETEDGNQVRVLYAAPPAPVAQPVQVPEPITRNEADGWWMYKGRRVGGGCAEWYNLALEDCRAAMLKHQSSNGGQS